MAAQSLQMHFARKIRQARLRLGLTQRQAAERAAIDYRHYQNIESGRSDVRLSTISRIQEQLSSRLTVDEHDVVADMKGNGVVVLDLEGNIIGVNEQWNAFASENRGDPSAINSANYLAVCTQAAQTGEVVAVQFLKNFAKLKAGQTKEFNLEYTCHAPHEDRWFSVFVTKVAMGAAEVVIVNHVRIR